jgi:hypothetical protein
MKPTQAIASLCVLGALPAIGQDHSVLRINEVIADNRTVPPADIGGNHVDMIEIFNGGPDVLDLGVDSPFRSLALSGTLEPPPPTALWTFPRGTRILPGDSIVVFCDTNAVENACEPHASFRLESDGTEPVTLWGPVVDGTRPIIDQVWLPPLPNDVSFGRFPDGAGPAPVPLDEVLQTFVFYPPGQSTFGACIDRATRCLGERFGRLCRGRPNGPGGNLPPRIEREEYSTNAPAADEPVLFRVRIQDDREPTPPNIARAEIVYRVDGGPEKVAELTFDAARGILRDEASPFHVWTSWLGEIPGQPAGALVEFHFRVADGEGLTDTSPERICADGVGPCNRFFGGPGCTLDVFGGNGMACNDPIPPGVLFDPCQKPFSFTVGYDPERFSVLAINEVLASQDGLYLDATEAPGGCDPEDLCPAARPDCCKYRDDAIELVNSGPSSVDLSGLWLAQSPFAPRGWQFPPGSSIAPGQYLIVWIDDDGGKCPDPSNPEFPCFWECPDPTDPAPGEFHTGFELRAEGDYIGLFDREEKRFGLIHGVRFGEQTMNRSLQLIPDGDRTGRFLDGTPTLGGPNAFGFLRGDADANCAVEITDALVVLHHLFLGRADLDCPDAADGDDSGQVEITDAIFILNYLFLGAGELPAPGPSVSGDDPTSDDLETCRSPQCL